MANSVPSFFLLITCDGTTVRQINSECCDTVFGFDQGSDNKQTLIGSFKILLVRKLKKKTVETGSSAYRQFSHNFGLWSGEKNLTEEINLEKHCRNFLR